MDTHGSGRCRLIQWKIKLLKRLMLVLFETVHHSLCMRLQTCKRAGVSMLASVYSKALLQWACGHLNFTMEHCEPANKLGCPCRPVSTGNSSYNRHVCIWSWPWSTRRLIWNDEWYFVYMQVLRRQDDLCNGLQASFPFFMWMLLFTYTNFFSGCFISRHVWQVTVGWVSAHVGYELKRRALWLVRQRHFLVTGIQSSTGHVSWCIKRLPRYAY